MMFRSVATTRIVAAAVVLALAPAMVRWPALAALVTLAVVLVVLNVVEHRRVNAAAAVAERAGEAAPEAVGDPVVGGPV